MMPMTRSRSDRQPQATAKAYGPQDGAAEVLEVVPALMDVLRTAMRRQVGDQLSVPQFRCLNFIARHPGGSIGAAAAFLGVAMPTASVMVDRLVRAGAVEPRTSAADRRRAELFVTEAGRALLTEIRRGAHDELARVLSARTPQELSQVQAGLSVLRQAFALS
jgi:DNA-binding MarR family transcriptional regulator